MSELRAEVTFPFRDDERAAMALRGDLRVQAATGFGEPLGEVTVNVPVEEVDELGRTWWRWAGSASTTNGDSAR